MWLWSGMVVVCRYNSPTYYNGAQRIMIHSNNLSLATTCALPGIVQCVSIFCLKDCRRIWYVYVKLRLDKRIMHSCKTTFAGFGCSLTTMIRVSGWIIYQAFIFYKEKIHPNVSVSDDISMLKGLIASVKLRAVILMRILWILRILHCIIIVRKNKCDKVQNHCTPSSVRR